MGAHHSGRFAASTGRDIGPRLGGGAIRLSFYGSTNSFTGNAGKIWLVKANIWEFRVLVVARLWLDRLAQGVRRDGVRAANLRERVVRYSAASGGRVTRMTTALDRLASALVVAFALVVGMCPSGGCSVNASEATGASAPRPYWVIGRQLLRGDAQGRYPAPTAEELRLLAAEVVPVLVWGLTATDPQIRGRAIGYVVLIGRPVVPYLEDAVREMERQTHIPSDVPDVLGYPDADMPLQGPTRERARQLLRDSLARIDARLPDVSLRHLY